MVEMDWYVHVFTVVYSSLISLFDPGFRGSHRDAGRHPSSSSPDWLEYVYRTGHPVLCWLPTKLAEWIGENLQEALRFPDKADMRARPGTGWTPDELNHILQAHVVDGSLTTFGCVEWESELFRGVMSARCYPFKMPKHRFHSFNPQVFINYYSSTYLYILCTC